MEKKFYFEKMVRGDESTPYTLIKEFGGSKLCGFYEFEIKECKLLRFDKQYAVLCYKIRRRNYGEYFWTGGRKIQYNGEDYISFMRNCKNFFYSGISQFFEIDGIIGYWETMPYDEPEEFEEWSNGWQTDWTNFYKKNKELAEYTFNHFQELIKIVFDEPEYVAVEFYDTNHGFDYSLMGSTWLLDFVGPNNELAILRVNKRMREELHFLEKTYR